MPANAISGVTIMSEVARRLTVIDARVRQLPSAMLALFIIILASIKHGFTYVQMFEDRFFTETPDALRFPGLVLSRSLLLTRMFNLESRIAYQIFSVLGSLAVLAVIAWLLLRRLPKDAAVVAFAAICLGQIGLMCIGQFGREDTWLILGAALLMLSGARSWQVWIVGACLMGLSNPGQALVATLLMMVMTRNTRFKCFRVRSAIALGTTSVWMAAVYLVQEGNQVDALDAYWLTGVNGFLVSGPLRLYSIYGILWLGVLALALASRGRELFVYLFALIAAPVTIVILTGDGTRVGVGVSSLMVLALVVKGVESLQGWFHQRIGSYALTAGVLLLFIAPSVNVYEFQVVLPWEWMKYQFGDLVVSATDEVT